MMMLWKYSLAWPSIHLCCWTLTLTSFRSWRGWRSYCMTNGVLRSPSMKHASYSFVMRAGQWKTAPYPRCSSPTCQACSIPRRYLDKQYKHSASTSISTWLWLDEGTTDIHGHPRGYQFGWLFLRCRGHVGNSLNVVVKGHAPLANVPKQIYHVHHCASVNAKYEGELIYCHSPS